MPPRIASGPSGDRGRLKAQILARPASVEDGLRVLDADLPAGTAGTIDLVLLDRGGALVLLAIATDDPDAALLRLLDQQVWAAEQRGVLLRLYATAGLRTGAPLRGLLLSPRFSPSFLRRLPLLSTRVEAYLARPLPDSEDAEALIEPAAAIFGDGEALRQATGGTERAADETPRVTDATPHGAAAEAAPRDRGRAGDERSVGERSGRERRPTRHEASAEAPAEVEIPDPLDEPPLPPPADLGIDAVLHGADPFEPLTAEELEAFEVFERQRRSRERRSS